MQQFPVAGGELQVGGMPLRGLTEQVDHTPFYAYDRRVIDEQVTLLRHCLPRTAPDNGLRSVREEAERQRIREALQIHQRQMTRTARTLGISHKTLREKMKKLGIDKDTP